MSVLSPLRRLSLLARILIVVGIVIALSFPIRFLLFAHSEVELYRATLENHVHIVLDTLEQSIGEQAVIGDYAAIQQIIETRVRDSKLVEVDYTDQGGNSVVATDPQPDANYPDSFRAWLDLPEKPVSRKIVVGGRDYGEVTIWLSHKAFANHMWKTALQQLLLGVPVAMALFAVIALTLRHGLRPLRVVGELASSLRNGEYQCLSLPMGSAAPEIRDTIATFNDAASREAWLARFAEIISGQSAGETKIREVMKLVCARLGMDAAVLSYRDESGGTVVGAAFYAVPDAECWYWQGYAAKVCEGRKPVLVDSHAYRDVTVIQDSPATYLGVPVHMGADVCAAFSVYSSSEIALPQRNGEVGLMELCGSWIGAALTQQQQEREIREQKEHVEAILNNMVEGVVMLNDAGQILVANPSMERIYGYHQHEIVGRMIWQLIPDIKWDQLGRSGACSTNPNEDCCAFGKTHKTTSRRKDGETIYVEMSLNEVRGAAEQLMVAIIRDVTERVRAEEALRRSEARLQRAQSVAQLGSWEYFPTTGRTLWSPELYRIFGLPQAVNVSYAEALERVHADDRQAVDEAFRHILEGKPVQNIEFRIAAGGRGERSLVLSAERLEYDDPGRTRVVGVVQDITERKQVEAEIQAALVEKMEAEARGRAKGQFLAHMTHELRTPLNAILGFSELLQQDMEAAGNSSAVGDLQIIHSAGKHLLALINQVLDLSKIEAGRVEIMLQEVEVAPFVSDIFDMVEPLAEKNRNSLHLAIEEGLGMITVDPTKLKQILLNLLGNACKFTEQGEILLTVQREMTAGEGWVRFSIRDTGVGMTQEQVGRLFEPFVQADASISEKYGGTGLGLSISKSYCEMMGGQIFADSVAGRGSEFVVRLPSSGSVPAAKIGHEVMSPTVINASDSRISLPPGLDRRSYVSTILVGDGDPAICKLMERYLSSEGFRVVSTNNGAALPSLARQHQPEVIVLDDSLRNEQGESLLSVLRADARIGDTPIVLVALHGDEAPKHTGGAADIISKPIQWHAFSAAVKKWVRGKTAGSIARAS